MESSLDDSFASPALLQAHSRPFYYKLPNVEELSGDDVSGKAEGWSNRERTDKNPWRSSSPSPPWSFYKRWLQRAKPGRSTSLKGWRIGLWIGFWTSTIVLLGNVIMAVLGASRNGGYKDGIGILEIGHADKISSTSTAYHALINILSTALLTTSNFCMQILGSPTRQEVEKAHKKGTWVSIGVLSPGNLRYIDRSRLILWWLLAISSLPLHLLYNTSIFAVTIGQEYYVHVANGSDTATVERLAQGNVRNLTNTQWTKLYNTQYVPGAGNLVLVADKLWFDAALEPSDSRWIISNVTIGDSFKPPLLYHFGSQETMNQDANRTSLQMNENGTFSISPIQTQYRVLLNLTTDIPSLAPFAHMDSDFNFNFDLSDAAYEVSPAKSVSYLDIVSFTNYNYSTHDSSTTLWMENPSVTISYALSQQLNDGSQIQISLAFILVVIGCNLVKVFVIYTTIKLTSNASFRPLITGGDAIASFLENPEPMTTSKCLYDRKRIMSSTPEEAVISPRVWKSKVRLLGNAAAGDAGSLAGMYITIALSIFLSITGLTVAFPNSGSDIYADGAMAWGTSSQSQLSIAKSSFDTRGLLFNAWLANAPQVLLSMSYVATNRICTAMAFALEWDEHASKRKGLRVSSPSGQQRGTYFLSLPLRRAIPLTAVSCLLHWLLSQAIFLVRLDIRDSSGNIVASESKSTCCYSLLSFAVFVVVFLLLQLTVLAFVLRRIRPRMPPAACCSLVISAACHASRDEGDLHLQPVQWGVVPAEFGSVGHCTFSSELVMPVRSGCVYT